MLMPGRQYPASGNNNYRYGFNGKELDNDINGNGVDYDYGARISDARIGRFFSVDPITDKFAYYTPFQFAGDSPIENIDQDGFEPQATTRDGRIIAARDGQLQKPLTAAQIKNYILPIATAPKKNDIITQSLLDLTVGIVGPINTIVTGKTPDGRKANGFDYAAAPLQILESLPMEGVEGGAPVNDFNSGYLPESIKIEGTGEYRDVAGHHVHAQASFKGDITYNSRTGFSISQEFMDENGLDHDAMTQTQRKLFKQLEKSGKPNTMLEQTRIAKEALTAGGATESMANDLIDASLANLRKQNVTQPTKIPWSKPVKK